MKRIFSIVLAIFILFSLCGCETGGAKTQNIQWHFDGDIEITQAEVQTIVNGNFKTPKNIIMIIGDGMGANDIEITQNHSKDIYDFGLVLNQIPNHGIATTHSADNEVTDSAASGTALSTGVKTNNGYVGMDVNQNDLKTMAERAREAGKRVGIVTDDTIVGATPTAFVTHCVSREDKDTLANLMFDFCPDVLIGESYDDFYYRLSKERQSSINKKYIVSQEVDEFSSTLNSNSNLKKPFLGFNGGYTSYVTNNLAYCAQVAFNRLKNDKGFFLMIESSGTDKYGHSNAIKGKISSVVNLDRTVAAALLFMKENPDTLLVITSDHETGGVKLPDANSEPTDKLFMSGSHTATPVRVFAVGQGSEYFKDKTVDNTDISKFVIDKLKKVK
ncbi:MAG: alkaline phosphatase [bacterium]|nr:alkaline phosphatase [bacterium]